MNGHRKRGFKRLTRLRTGYQHLRYLSAQELEAWFAAVERAVNASTGDHHH